MTKLTYVSGSLCCTAKIAQLIDFIIFTNVYWYKKVHFLHSNVLNRTGGCKKVKIQCNLASENECVNSTFCWCVCVCVCAYAKKQKICFYFYFLTKRAKKNWKEKIQLSYEVLESIRRRENNIQWNKISFFKDIPYCSSKVSGNFYIQLLFVYMFFRCLKEINHCLLYFSCVRGWAWEAR